RLALYDLAVNAIYMKPWTGWGLGSFEPLFSAFQPASLLLRYDKAHNVYLESAMELGIPMTCLLLVAIAAIAARCVRGMRDRRRDRQFSAAAFGSTVFLGLHSLVDFGVQIPAVAIAYAAILGLGWTHSWSSRINQPE